MNKRLLWIAVSVVLLPVASRAAQEPVIETSICGVVADPSAFNHKLIKLTGDVTHGFKQLTIAANDCKTNLTAIWLEYGGQLKAPSVYDPKDVDGKRDQRLVVEGIKTNLVNNPLFLKFDKMIAEWSYESHIKVTLIGRYFAGRHDQSSGFESWNGYGHQACCSLLVIEQVLAIDKSNP